MTTVLATLLLLSCFGLQPSIAAEDGALDPTFAPVLRANGGINTLSIQTDGKVLIGGNFTYVNNTPRKYIARLNTDGSLDTTYTLDLSGKVDAIVLQPDGKILISEEYDLIRFNTDGTVDSTFDPGTGPDFTSSIRAIALQTDGKILIGGGFTSFNGIQRNHIARLNADGSLDTGFDPGTGADDKVYSLVVQSDGKVVIGGSFSSFNDISRNGIARLNTNGSLDTTFDPGTGTKDTNGYTGIISSVVLQSDGKILAGGGFSSINGVTQKYLARFNSDGSLDTTFTFTSSTNGIFKLKLQSDGKILAVQAMPAGYSYFRLNSDGSSDTSFTVGTLNDLAGSFAIQSDGKILIGGGFTDINGISHSNIARINNDGSVDTGFDAGSIEQNGSVDSLAIQTDDKVLIAGSFSSINGTPRKKLARLNIDGSLDTSFDYREQIDVEVITLQPDEKVLIGGDQTGIKRLNADGSLGLDASFESIQWWSTIETIITRPDGKILIGGWLAVDKGNFQTENYHIVQLNTNGSLDTSFTPSTSNDSFNLKLVVQTDAKVLVGGSFTTINGLSRNRIARLNTDGTIDTSFNPDIDNRVESLFVQPDGDILIGGTFTNINGITRNHIARLNSDGSLDTSFDPNINGTVDSVILQSDGKVLIGGSFSNFVDGILVYGIARLNADGSLDTNFDPGTGTDRSVNVLALQSNDNVIIGGYFTQVNGIARSSGIARLSNSTMPIVNLSVSTNTGTEIDTSTITVTATASKAVNGNQTVDLGVSGTGIMASDYNLSATQIPILDGTTSGNVNLTIQDDADSEGTEMATLTISNPSAGIALANPITQNVTIIDNDMPEPAIAINPPTVAAGNVLAGTPNHVLYRLNLAITTANAMLTGITVTTGGTYQTSDIGTNSFKLHYSTDATLDAGDAVLKNLAVVASGNNLVFDNLTQNIGKDTTGYLFVTADIATSAIIGHTININANPLNNITFAVGVKSGDDPQPASGVQTIAVPPSSPAAPIRLNVGTNTSQAALNWFDDSDNETGFKVERSDDSQATWTQIGLVESDFVVYTDTGLNCETTYVYRVRAYNDIGDSAYSNTKSATTETCTASTDGESDLSFFSSQFRTVGKVKAIIKQPDGKLLIGGEFYYVNGVAIVHVARLNQDGSLDTTFTPESGAYGTISSLALQLNGKILIGNAGNLMRLNSNGSIDTIFNATTDVHALVVQSDGKIIAGGYTSSAPLIRLNMDGSVDSSFSVGSGPAGTGVDTVVIQSDGKIIIGGQFTSFNGVPRHHIARINTDGSLDNTFTPELSVENYDRVESILLQTDGKIVIGGYFSSVNGISRNNVARLNSDGSIDSSFDPGTGTNSFPVTDSSVRSIDLQDNGKILIAGSFSNYNGFPVNGIARLNSDGSLDTTFSSNPIKNTTGMSAWFESVVFETGGQVVAGGNFSHIDNVHHISLVRFESDGSLNTELNTNAEVFAPPLSALAVQTNDQILVGGEFTSVNNIPKYNLARLNADGRLETNFDSGDGAKWINSILPMANGKIIVQGSFSEFNNNAYPGLVRLNQDGSIDTSFVPGLTDTPSAIGLGFDGNILVGGYILPEFTPMVARFTSDGTLDSSFSTQNVERGISDGGISALVSQSDGKILVGGSLINIGGETHNRIARLNNDGTLDSSFNTGTGADGSYISTIALQTDGKILIGGDFSNFNGVSRNDIARLNADGSLDSTFNPGTGTGTTSGSVSSILVQADQSILVIGNFSTFNNEAYTNIVRLFPDGTIDTGFDPDIIGFVRSVAPQSSGNIIVKSISSSLVRLFQNFTDTVVNLSVDTNSATEMDSTTVTITVTSTNPVSGNQTIDLNVSGTGITSSDYVLSNTQITIPDGTTSGTATFTIQDDADNEGEETAVLTISNPSADITLGSIVTQAIVITDNDQPAVNLSISSNTATEADMSVVTITATATNAVIGNQTVDVNISGTGISGSDYSLSGTQITIIDGTTNGSVNFTVQDDADIEEVETAMLTISNPSAGIVLGTTITKTVSITDNDEYLANLSITKTDSTDPVSTGAALSYTLNVSNAGPDPATSVEVTDTLPSGVVFSSASGTDWTCNEAAGTVICSIASLNTGAANPITINVTAPGTAGSITNMATVSATTNDPDTVNNTDSEVTMVSDTPPSQTDLSITQTDSIDPVFTTMPFTYTLNVNNAGPGTANNIEVTDTLPGNVVFDSASGTDWICNELSGIVTCTLANLSVGAANPIMISVMAPNTIGSITNNATVNAITTDPDTSNNNVSESTQVDNWPPPAQADLSITKTGFIDSVLIGTRFSYVLNVNNAGPDIATDIVVSDDLHNGVIFSSASGEGWTCYETGGYINCPLASLNTGAANPLTINVIAPGTVSMLSKTAGVSTSANDPDFSNNNVSDSIQVYSSPPASMADLSVTQADSADPVLAGTSFAYTLNVNNAGPAIATNVEVVDVLPNGITFNSASAIGWTCNESNGTVICTQASLSVGVANPITINVTEQNFPGNYHIDNHVSISSSTTPDPQTNNNQAIETTTINTTPHADLGISQTDSSEPVLMDSNFSYTLNINNAGPDTATNVEVTDTLPMGVTFVSANGTDWNCNELAGLVTCTLASLNVGTANPITINVTAPSTATRLYNTASITSTTTTDSNTTNNWASETTTVNNTPPFEADLSITKTHTPDPLFLLNNFRYTLNVNNAGPDTATDIEVIDTLPNGVNIANYPHMDWMCSDFANTVTCTLPSLSVGAANPIHIDVGAPSTVGNMTSNATVRSQIGVDPDTSNNSVSENAMVNDWPQTDLSITKTDSADPVSTGAAFSYTLNVNNAGSVPVTDVEVIDILPVDVGFDSATGTDWICNEYPDTVVVVKCTLANLNVGAANSITINVTAPGTAGSITSHASVKTTMMDDTDMSNNNVSEDTTVTSVSQQADLSITKTDSTDPIFTGAALSYTLNVNNAGPDPATTVEVTDTLPSGVVFSSASGTDWTCNEAAGTVTCTIASLSTGAANPITINVTAPGTAGSITNMATISATTADPDTSDNSVSESTTVNTPPQADLSITKTDSTDPVFIGAALSYTLNVNNAGPDTATTVEVTDTLPSGVVFSSASGTDWTCNEAAGTVTCSIASLSTGAANPITINVTAPGTAGSLTNMATVSATTADPDTSNNNVSESTTVNVLPQADLSITKTDSTDPVFTGSALTYTLNVNNAGPDTATTVEVTDTLPSGVVFSSASGTDWTCNEAAGTVTCTLASLNIGAANPITINVTAPGTAGSITNTTTVTSLATDPDTTNNSASESTTVNTLLSQADLSITKTDSSDPVLTHNNFSYTLTVNNNGPDTANNVEVIDTLPGSVTFGSASGTDWTCNQSGGTVTCTLASLGVGVANPITINVTAPSTSGSITNNATVSAVTTDPVVGNNTASQGTTVNTPPPPPPPPSRADLSITKSDSTDPVFTGADLSYTLNVKNAGPNTAFGIEVTDTLPNGVVFVSASGTDWDCENADNKVTCAFTRFLLSMGDANPITINVTAPSTAGSITNEATVSTTTSDPNTNNNSVSESTTVNILPQADLSINQGDSSDPILTNSNFSYTLIVNNVGPDTADNIEVIDTLPSGVVFNSASGTDWTCSESGGTVNCTRASLDVGATSTITINVTTQNTAGTIINKATVSATTLDPDTNNNNVSQTITVNTPPPPPKADLSITKTGSSKSVLTGKSFRYTLTVNNAGPDTANNVQVTDILADNLNLIGITGTNWSCSGWRGKVNCTLANLSVGKAAPIILDVSAPSTAGSITNTATVKAITADPDTNNNEASETTTVNIPPPPPKADLSITQSDSRDPVFIGNTFSYTLNLHNAGPDIATNIKVTNFLPGKVAFISVNGTDWTCKKSGIISVTCRLPSLNVGAADPITINVRAPSRTGSIANTVTVSARTVDPDMDNNKVKETTVVNIPPPPPPPKADLSITQMGLNTPVLTNDAFTYSLSVKNAGPNSAYNVKVIDTLPEGVTFSSASGTDWKCQESEGKVTCNLKHLKVGEANPITIEVTAPTIVGNIINKATVDAATLDTETDNNRIDESTMVNRSPQADLFITHSSNDELVLAGKEFSYTVNIQNSGQDTATNVKVTDNLYGGDFISANGTGWTCNASGTQMVCTLASLNPGETSQITVNVIASATSHWITYRTSVVAETTDPDSSNNRASKRITPTRVTSVEPQIVYLNIPAIFEIRGWALPENLGFSLEGCEAVTAVDTAHYYEVDNFYYDRSSSYTSYNPTSKRQLFYCMPVALGEKMDGRIVAQNQGTVVSEFKIDIVSPRKGTIWEIAGRGEYYGIEDGPAIYGLRAYDDIYRIATDSVGNLYMTTRDNRIRKIDSQGIITTIAGYKYNGYKGEYVGQITGPKISYPHKIAIDKTDNLYVTGYNKANEVYKIDTHGTVTIIVADGEQGVRFGYLSGIVTDDFGNVYVAGKSKIWKINKEGTITLIAGGGKGPDIGDGGLATKAILGDWGLELALDYAGNLYVLDRAYYRIRKIDQAGIISTVADNIYATSIAVDSVGNLYVSESGRIQKIDREGIITTVAGGGTESIDGYEETGMLARNAKIGKGPITLDSSGNLYIAQSRDYIYKIIGVGESLPFSAKKPVLITQVTDRKVTLSWNSIHGATGYELLYGYDKFGRSENVALSQTFDMGNKTELTVDNVKIGTHHVAIRAYNADGERSVMSDTAVAVVGLPKPEPFWIKYNDKGELVLWWEAVEGAVGYSVYYGIYTDESEINFHRSPEISPLPFENANVRRKTTLLKASFPNVLLARGKYYIAIQAYDAEGHGGLISEPVLRTVKLSILQRPKLTVESNGTQVTFSWKPLPGATQYEIVGGPPNELWEHEQFEEMALREQLVDPKRKIETNVGNVTSWSIESLPEGIYDAKIRAYDDEGNYSDYSEPARFSIFYLKASCDIPERNALYSVYQLLYEPFLDYGLSETRQKISDLSGEENPHNRVDQGIRVAETISLTTSLTGSGSLAMKAMETSGYAMSISGNNIFIPELIDGISAFVAGATGDLPGLASYFVTKSVGIVNHIWGAFTANKLRKQLGIMSSSKFVLDKYYWRCGDHNEMIEDFGHLGIKGDVFHNCKYDFLTCAAVQHHRKFYGSDDDADQKILNTIVAIITGVNTSMQSLRGLVLINPVRKPALKVEVNYPEIKLFWTRIKEATGYKIFAGTYSGDADIEVNEAIATFAPDITTVTYAVNELTDEVPQGKYYVLLQADHADGTRGISERVVIDFRDPASLSDKQLLALYSPIMYFAEDDYTPRAIYGFVEHAILVEDQSKIIGFNLQVLDDEISEFAKNEGFELNPDIVDISTFKELSGNNPPTGLQTDASYSLDFLNGKLDGKHDGKDYRYFDYKNPFKSFPPMEVQHQSAPVVYGHVVNQNDRKYLQYHFFYYINNWNKNGGPVGAGYHEGDWEYMVIELGEENRPLRVSASVHVPNVNLPGRNSNCTSQLGGETRTWNKMGKSGTHPKVYIGQGGHPTYLYKDITAYNVIDYLDILSEGQDRHNHIDKVYVSDETIHISEQDSTPITYQSVKIDENETLCDDKNVCRWLKQDITWGHIDNLIPGVGEIVEPPVKSPIARFLSGKDDGRWAVPRAWMDKREQERCGIQFNTTQND